MAEPGAAEFAEGEPTDCNLPRAIQNVCGGALPDVRYAWRWAHAQISADEGQTTDQLLAILRDQPGSAVCRLMCPRRLRPKTRYAAFVVPTFKLGLLAGLGRATAGVEALQPAWTRQDTNLELPYYYRWEFSTAPVGDFAYLVGLLEPRPLAGRGAHFGCSFIIPLIVFCHA
jgi:hypothetical protein